MKYSLEIDGRIDGQRSLSNTPPFQRVKRDPRLTLWKGEGVLKRKGSPSILLSQQYKILLKQRKHS